MWCVCCWRADEAASSSSNAAGSPRHAKHEPSQAVSLPSSLARQANRPYVQLDRAVYPTLPP
jgi:hypothetical protein